VQARQSDFSKFGVGGGTLFQPERPGYLAFLPVIAAKPHQKITLEADPALQRTLTAHHDALEAWWGVAAMTLRNCAGARRCQRSARSC